MVGEERSGRVERVVAEDDTASSHGSGDVAVLATPAVVALVEAAAVRAVAGTLEHGQTTVGTSVSLEHLAPTPVGSRVTATATLVEVDGRRLVFEVAAHDPAGEVARGRHTRVVVDRRRFEERSAERR